MKNYDSNIYLYAKGWYKHADTLSDLKVLYGDRNGVHPEDMRIEDIIHCLLGLVSKHYFKREHQVLDFISGLHPEQIWKVWRFGEDKYDYDKAVISKCLSVLCMTNVVDIENGLDEPDYDLLPMKEKDSETKR